MRSSNEVESDVKILTSEEMKAVDERTASESGVPFAALMEHAGEAVAHFVLRQYAQAERILVLCGKGNNGGDGLVAARVLAGEGIGVRVMLLGRSGELRGDAANAMTALREQTAAEVVEEVTDEESLEQFADSFREADLLIDAVVGTGFKPPLRGIAAALRDRVNALSTPVVAVDLPSGWSADAMTEYASGETAPEHAETFRADAVVTFTAPKLAHVFGHLTPGHTFGPVVVAPIGSPDAVVQSAQRLRWTGSAKRIAEQPREINSNKGKFGHVLLAAGSHGKAGAPSMSSLACLRTGAGLVTAAVPRSIVNTVALITPELMLAALLEDEAGSVSLANLEEKQLAKLVKGTSVVAIGPGLGTEGEASEFARQLAAKTTAPLVIDADGLNAFAGKAELLKGLSGVDVGKVPLRGVVLTPHPGEMGRLAGISTKEVEADRIGLARRFATEHGVTLVLKGWRTLVAHPNGDVAVNTTGNPAMAKGGSGDILTGIVAAMMAQFPDRLAEAVEAAVYLHGLAADFAVFGFGTVPDRGRDEHTVLATDTIAHLTDAFRHRTTDEDGFEWICGMRREALEATP